MRLAMRRRARSAARSVEDERDAARGNMASRTSPLMTWIAAGLVTAGAALAGWSALHRAPARPRTASGAARGPERGGTARTARATERRAAPEPAPRKPTRPPEGEVVVRAAWGAEVGALGRKAPSEGAPEAPMSFAVDGRGRVHVLDQL